MCGTILYRSCFRNRYRYGPYSNTTFDIVCGSRPQGNNHRARFHVVWVRFQADNSSDRLTKVFLYRDCFANLSTIYTIHWVKTKRSPASSLSPDVHGLQPAIPPMWAAKCCLRTNQLLEIHCDTSPSSGDIPKVSAQIPQNEI